MMGLATEVGGAWGRQQRGPWRGCQRGMGCRQGSTASHSTSPGGAAGWLAFLHNQRQGPRNPQASPDVAAHPDRHSLLPPLGDEGPRAFVVPGARFREMYYWCVGWVAV